MKRKPGFTLDQHENLGIELQIMRDRLVDITVQLSEAYPFKVSDIAKQAYMVIDKLRSVLDDKVHEENRSFKDAQKVYYRSGE